MLYFNFRTPAFMRRPFRTASTFFLESQARRERDFEYLPDAISFERIVANQSSPVNAMNTFLTMKLTLYSSQSP